MGFLRIGMSSSKVLPAPCLLIFPSRPGYIPPKKPYGFEAMMNDILNFAARTLVTGGRLCMWMPTSGEEEAELSVPMQENLEVLSISVQPFNNCKYLDAPSNPSLK
jgi:tRNA G10  N-methylase Trm11